MKNYLQEYMSFAQDDGLDGLSIATNAINAQDFFSTKTSLFFMEYSGHLDMIDMELGPNNIQRSPITDADRMLCKLQNVGEGTQSAMALAQQQQEKAANRKRDGAVSFKMDDKVGLNLTNINTNQVCKKLDAKYVKFTILEIVDTHVYCLDISPGIHNVFHIKRLRLIASDSLPGQIVSEPQSIGIVSDTKVVEYEMEKILKERKGRGDRMKYLVKGTGYTRPTGKPRDALEETFVLDIWERRLEREEGDNVTD